MVHVFIASCREADTMKKEWQYVPQHIIARNKRFIYQKDARRHMMGNILLMRGLRILQCNKITLHDLWYNEFGKPCLPAGINFNISHSGNYVVCAISLTVQVGIDMEEIKDLETDVFENCFTTDEWACINNANDRLKTFYEFWTRKEAIIKIDGRGLHMPLTSFDVINDRVTAGSSTWYLTALSVAPGYTAHLATNEENVDKFVQQTV